MMPPKSLQWRLSLWLGLGVALLWAVAAAVTAHKLRHEMNEVFDSALEETAQRILPLAVLDIVGRDSDDADQRVATLRQHDEYFTYVVRDAEGKVLLRSHNADLAVFPPFTGMGFANTPTHRIYFDAALRGTVTIAVAEPLAHRRAVAKELLFGLALPLGIAQRLLIGLKRTTSQTTSQAVVAPFMLGMVALCVILALPAGPYLALFSYLASVLVSLICLAMVARSLPGMVPVYFRRIFMVRRYPGVPTMGLAWPMLLQMIALPLAMQTDRILLSHLRGTDDVAEYNLAAQLFGMAIQVINAGGMVLWPHFSKARSDGVIHSPFKITVVFLGFGLLISAALAVLAPWLAEFMSSGKITLSLGLLLAFVLLTTLQAAKYPMGMYMTDFSGLRFQVLPIFCMVPLSLGLSIYLIGIWGPAGTVIGSCIAVFACQVMPNFFYVRRDLRRRAQQAAAPVAAPPAS